MAHVCGRAVDGEIDFAFRLKPTAWHKCAAERWMAKLLLHFALNQSHQRRSIQM